MKYYIDNNIEMDKGDWGRSTKDIIKDMVNYQDLKHIQTKEINHTKGILSADEEYELELAKIGRISH